MAPCRRITRTALAGVMLVAAVALLTGGTRRIAPEWTIEVRDESGRPVPGVSVRQSFKDYTLNEEPRSEDSETRCADSSGRVTFPARATWAWPGQVIMATIAKISALFRMCGPSFGTVATVAVRTRTTLREDAAVSECFWYMQTGRGAPQFSTCIVRSGWTPPYRCGPE
jgi:hypothetical protein